MRLSLRNDHSTGLFFKRTVAAQIHFAGLIAAAMGLAVLLRATMSYRDDTGFWPCLAFGCAAILVFAVSAAFHFLSDGLMMSPELEKLFEDLDHFSIYLFIAGTYTPILQNTLREPGRTQMTIAVWSIALAGITYTFFKDKLPKWAVNRWLSTGLFVAMGFVFLARLSEILRSLSPAQTICFAIGAVAYTAGAVVYASRKPRLAVGVFGFHELWHALVLVGFAAHYFMILDFYRST